jgi:hypothetical protein
MDALSRELLAPQLISNLRDFIDELTCRRRNMFDCLGNS